jgi:fluoroacetyl-CoA thioesterase
MEENGLRIGLIGEASSKVSSAETARKMGSGAVEVYATPAMIALMEAAALSAVDPHLADGQVTVGIEVAVKHISATPVGEGITAIAEVTRIDGKRIHLEVRAWDERELIGIGNHVRYIIEAADFEQRLRRPNQD